MNDRPKLRVAILERSYLIREGFSEVIRKAPEMCVMALPNDLLELTSPPDVVLVSCQNSYFDTMRELTRVCPSVRFIAINADSDDLSMLDYIRFGIIGFLSKDADANELLQTIRSVAAGTPVVPLGLAASLCQQLMETGKNHKGTWWNFRVTRREKKIIELISDGLTNKEIALQLNVATNTVKSHVHSILEKLQLPNRIAVMKFCGNISVNSARVVHAGKEDN